MLLQVSVLGDIEGSRSLHVKYSEAFNLKLHSLDL